MIQALAQSIAFDEFIAWYPENSETRYELHRGVIVEMPKPRGKHSDVAGFLSGSLFIEIGRMNLSYFIPRECIVRTIDGESGYEPDVIVLDRQTIADDLQWEKESVITKGKSTRLVIEVVSTNWRDDYAHKFTDYEALGIPEYWQVDYLGLGGRRYIGNPKQPTLSVCELIDGEYEIRQFRGSDPSGICEAARIISPTLPDLQLTAEQVFAAGQ
ncbi:MAG: Uma2 family endonuclease [Myxacorys chilensis ATA2-1-KO14]|jgi:Uma2 family endonuclease|nr:Uma2 family endonuclease [Myxacorys chilensis ATA2-1-KO14]